VSAASRQERAVGSVRLPEPSEPSACRDAPAHGALAQLGERLLCKHQVIGSIPIGSTTPRYPVDEDTGSRRDQRWVRAATALFDIVNGFLKSMPRGVGGEQGGCLRAARPGSWPAISQSG
jgi:hypothetical protein